MDKRVLRITHDVYADCSKCDGYPIVRPGLAVTPALVEQMTANGVAVSAQSSLPFVDGDVNPSWDMPLYNYRGVDMVDLWSAQRDARDHIRNHHNANAKAFGTEYVKQLTDRN